MPSKSPEKRRVRRFSVPKEDLLRILQEAAFAPVDATRIVGSGHSPEELVFEVAFDALEVSRPG